MNPELKQAWTNELLNDDTLQAKKYLRLTDNTGLVGRDVWGVLLDIYHATPGSGLVRHDDHTTGISSYEYRGTHMTVYPSYELLEDLGIPWNAGPSADIIRYLSALNDEGSNFNFIASEIMELL